MNMLNQKQKIIVIVLISLAIGVMIFQYIKNTKEIYSYEESLNLTEDHEEKINSREKEEKIIVHITGAVNKEGIVEVKENARINDVIQAAGGITADADLNDVNLAYVVEDGQKIYIPSKEDKINIKTEDFDEEVISDSAGTNVIEDKGDKKNSIININKTSLEGLKSLPGIRRVDCIKDTWIQRKSWKI